MKIIVSFTLIGYRNTFHETCNIQKYITLQDFMKTCNMQKYITVIRYRITIQDFIKLVYTKIHHITRFQDYKI